MVAALQGTGLPPTTVPARMPSSGAVPAPPRRRAVTVTGAINAVGAGLAALSLTVLLFGPLTPLSGLIGSAIVFYLLFLVIYGVLVSMSDDAVAVRDRLATVVLWTAACC